MYVKNRNGLQGKINEIVIAIKNEYGKKIGPDFDSDFDDFYAKINSIVKVYCLAAGVNAPYQNSFYFFGRFFGSLVD